MRKVPGIAYWVHKAALLHPHRTALVVPEGRMSYARLSERTRRAAQVLTRLGIGSGSRFAILMYNDPRFLELLFAAGHVGAVAVPLNWRLTAHELEYQVRDAGVSAVFFGPEQQGLAGQLQSRRPCRLVSVPGEYDTLLESMADLSAKGPLWYADLPGDDDPVLLVYTSGTTGKPKGAVLTHANLFWNAINDILALGLTYRDTTLTLLPLMHVGGIGLFTLPTLLAGGTVVMPRRFDASEALRLIAQERVTVFLGVPTVHKMIVESPDFERADLSSLRVVYNGGDRVPLSIVDAYRRRGLAFGGGYGLTETAPTAFMLEPEQFEAGTRALGFIGKPAFATDARVVNEAGRDVNPEEVGELWLRGPNVFREYWGLPAATQEAFTEGWFRTGDLAYQDPQGYTFVVGRKKEMIKSGGENVYPAEVEQVLLEHPKVAEACVIGRPHPKWNEVPFAVVALRPGQTATEEELRAFCAERLARYKVPAGFAFVDAIPRTSIGKPDRPLLIERYGRMEEESA